MRASQLFRFLLVLRSARSRAICASSSSLGTWLSFFAKSSNFFQPLGRFDGSVISFNPHESAITNRRKFLIRQPPSADSPKQDQELFRVGQLAVVESPRLLVTIAVKMEPHDVRPSPTDATIV